MIPIITISMWIMCAVMGPIFLPGALLGTVLWAVRSNRPRKPPQPPYGANGWQPAPHWGTDQNGKPCKIAPTINIGDKVSWPDGRIMVVTGIAGPSKYEITDEI